MEIKMCLRKDEIVHVTSLLTILHAAHYTWLVESPWNERGGIMLVAPPGQLKTTTINSLEMHSDALLLGDINVRSLKSIRDSVLGGRYRTLAISELEKLYARNPATAVNIEAHLKQFAEEGLRHFSFEDSNTNSMPARALIIAGMTPSMYGKMHTQWNESGFLRRFLRIHYVLEDKDAILDAIHRWTKIGITVPILLHGRATIPYNLTQEESKFLMAMMKNEPDSTPTVLMKKIACVLKLSQPKTWRKVFSDFSPSVNLSGALLIL